MGWNEARTLEFFFRHYDPWVSRYVFYDDGSTDGTQDIIAGHPRAELRRFERTVADSFVLSATALQNEVWKESRGRADWVVITAVDEHLHHPDIGQYLRDCMAAGVTLVPALGWQMIASEFPASGTHLAASLTRGAPFERMNKLSLFRPDAIADSGFDAGRHLAFPRGSLCLPEHDELRLLHYRYLGLDFIAARVGMLATGLGRADIGRGLGVEYLRGEQALVREIAEHEARALDLAGEVPVTERTHPMRWWWNPALGARFVPVGRAMRAEALLRDERAALRAAAFEARDTLRQVQQSSWWKLGMPVRHILGRHPRLRYAGRHFVRRLGRALQRR